MDVHNTIGGSLQISTEVIAKIARLAALEVDGVADVATGTSQNVRSLLGRTGLQKPVTVVMEDGIATVTVHLTVVYGSGKTARRHHPCRGCPTGRPRPQSRNTAA
jgi:uncharacterized alkaline shock family protein YloU